MPAPNVLPITRKNISTYVGLLSSNKCSKYCYYKYFKHAQQSSQYSTINNNSNNPKKLPLGGYSLLQCHKAGANLPNQGNLRMLSSRGLSDIAPKYPPATTNSINAVQIAINSLTPRFGRFGVSGASLVCSAAGLKSFTALKSARFFSTSSNVYQKATPTGTPEPESPLKAQLKAAKKRPLIFRIFYFSLLSLGSIFSALLTLLVGFFLYDATTYKDDTELTDVEVPALAMTPRRGGPKNLPISDAYLDEGDSDEMKVLSQKPRLVILGSGWGAVSLMKKLDPDLYNITLISPVNYFLFTPMLPSATVGTLEFRSLAEPIRRVCRAVKAHFLEASAEEIDFSNKLVEVTSKDSTGQIRNFYVPYDKLVIAVGCTTNTHGVQGLEYCHFLKTIQDARTLRNKVVANLERACLPTTSEEERKRLLSFVICGGGPTGVELAAEIYDVLNEDLSREYPKVIRNLVSVHILQSRSHILNTYDETVSNYAMDRFKKDSIDVLVNSRVERVLPDRVVFYQKGEDGERQYSELPYGVCVWSTGVAQSPFTKKVVESLGSENQKNKRAIETDAHLRVYGAPLGDVYAIGDCSTVRTDTAKTITQILKHHIVGRRKCSLVGENRISDEELAKISITYEELHDLAKVLRRKHPQAASHLNELRFLFDTYSNHKETLTMDELTALLKSIDQKITSLPATAQRASQQGEYLGRKFNKLGRYTESLQLNDIVDGDIDDALYRPFSYRHLGSLAYISNAAVFDLNGKSYFGGLIAMYLWRGVYFAQTVSFRTRAFLFMDWLKRGLFGRDLADISVSDSEKE